jgi:capsular polysaccharide transport system ATP-binding protein
VISVGDVSFKRKAKAVLSERLRNSTVLLVSHSPSILREFCSHGVVVEDGRLLHFDTLDDAISYHETSQGA